MGNFTEYLKQILSARYGKDVRQSIHDGIKETHDIATGAQNSATAAANTATSKASEAVAASKTAISKAEEALASAEQAKTYAENASAVTGIEIAKKDRAGIVKGGENHIAEDGTLTLTKHTTTPTLYNSHAGGVKVNGIGGVSEQERTSGAQLYNANDDYDDILPDAEGWFTYSYDNTNGTAIRYTGINSHVSELIQPNTQYAVVTEIAEISGGTILNVISLSTDEFRGQFNANVSYRENGTHIAYPSTLGNFEDCYTMLRTVVHIPVGAKGTVKFRLSVIAGTTVTADTFVYEKFTGGQPSPNPEFPQEIKSVKGKNELDCRGLVEKTVSGVTFTPIKDANGNVLYIEVNGTNTTAYAANYALPKNTIKKGEYIGDGCPSGGSASTFEIKFSNEHRDRGTGITMTLDSDTAIEPFIIIRAGYTATNLRFYPMIRKASIADPTYVPYGLLRFKGHGKNLFGFKNLVAENIRLSNSTFSHEGSNSVVINKISTVGQERYFATVQAPVDGKYTVSVGSSENIAMYGLKVSDEVPTGAPAQTNTTTMIATKGQFVTFVATMATSFSGTGILTDIQIEVGEKTTYEPYTEQSIILSEPIELNGINGVADELVSGTKRFATIVLNGGENWMASNSRSGRYGVAVNGKVSGFCMCTIAIRNLSMANFNECALNETGAFYINTHFETLDEWKAHLAEKPIAVTYELAEPIVEPLPTADQIALHSLMSYDGITYLTCDSEIQPTWDLEYGTSKVGAYTLDAWNTAKRSEIKQEAQYNEVVSALLTLNQE